MILYKFDGMLFWDLSKEIEIQDVTLEKLNTNSMLTESILDVESYEKLENIEKVINEYFYNEEVFDLDDYQEMVCFLQETIKLINIRTLNEGDLVLYQRIAKATSELHNLIEHEAFGE